MEEPNSLSIENPNVLDVLSELESLRRSYNELQCRSVASEETLAPFQARNLDLHAALDEALEERDSLRVRLIEAEVSVKELEEASSKERSVLAAEVEVAKARVSELVEERSKRNGLISANLDLVRSARECLKRIEEMISENKLEGYEEENSDFEDVLENLVYESKLVCNLGEAVESKFLKYDERRRMQKKDLEYRIASLTEENRDIGGLLRIAIVEKEAVEKSLNKLKANTEQKRGSIMQIAERGLQKVGFGFVIGVMGGGESQSDQQSSSTDSAKSDSSECEEEVVSLASTVETIVKNLRIEITDLRRDLGECRSENEHWQTLSDKQAQKIKDSELYIKDLAEREKLLSQTVEELMVEMKEEAEEVARWREACELEVKAGKAAILERENELTLLREELKQTMASLDAANGKLSLKEKLAATAMAAQAAAEVTLQLADNRTASLREQIEELTEQLEEEVERKRREKSGGWRRVRHVCWPWRVLRITPSAAEAAASHSERRRLRMPPEMECLLHFNI